MKTLPGKILLVDDQISEKELVEEALSEKQWKVDIEYFSDTKEALKYLKTTKDRIFLIISDINMPRIHGLEFKKIIDDDPVMSKKAVPFIFVSTAATSHQVQEAYTYRVQGYFQKLAETEDQAQMLDAILTYWVINQHPTVENLPVSTK